MFVFTLRKLLNYKFIDEVYLDSENTEILDIGKRLGAKLLKRDPELANNKTDGNKLFFNEVATVDADIYIQHLCTSPFVKEETIANAIKHLQDNPDCDSVVLGKSDKYYHWNNGKPAYDIDHIPNSVDLPSEETEAMALYVVRACAAKQLKRRVGITPYMIMGDPIELIDINLKEDLELAKLVGAGILAEEQKRLQVLGRFLTSPILSDIADEMGIHTVLDQNYKSNISGAKMFGRARTLHIREATELDPKDSIYHALQSYKQVVSNDIIVVKNDLPNLAYFGELNMSLAIRSGAVGAIVAGVTRDSIATAQAGFPVFAKGWYCKDIKGKGAVESINQPIILDDVLIEPSDLIFADKDGVVVIPRKREIEFISKALKIMSAEKNLVADVCNDVDVEGLVTKYGFF